MSMLQVCVFVFFKQKTSYEMRISDWSSDVCSSDLVRAVTLEIAPMGSSIHALPHLHDAALHTPTHRSPRTDISLPLSTCAGRLCKRYCLGKSATSWMQP